MTDQPPAYVVAIVYVMEFLTFCSVVALIAAGVRILFERPSPPDEPRDDGGQSPEEPTPPSGPVVEEERELTLV